MTGPLGAGYQDFARSFATSRFLTFPLFATVIAVPTTIPPIATVNMDSIGVRAFANNNHMRVTLNWYNDEGLVNFITNDEVIVRQGGVFDQSIVVKGSFLSVVVTPAGGANSTVTLIMYETTRSVISQHTGIANLLQNNAAVAVGAGATVTTEITRVWAGEATFWCSSSLATWSAVLEAIDELGNLTVMDFMNQTYPQTPRPIFFPSCTVRSRLINGTGAAGNIGIRITARPGMSGM